MGVDRIGSVGATNTVGDMYLPPRVFFYRMRGTVSHEPRVDNLSIWFDGRWYVNARRLANVDGLDGNAWPVEGSGHSHVHGNVEYYDGRNDVAGADPGAPTLPNTSPKRIRPQG